MYASVLHCVHALHRHMRSVSQHLVQVMVHQAAFPQSCDMGGLLPNVPDAKAFIQLCMQTCADMHPHPTLRIKAVVTASCQDARRAQRKFTPILLVIMKFGYRSTSELFIEVAHPARRGVNVMGSNREPLGCSGRSERNRQPARAAALQQTGSRGLQVVL